MKGDCRAAAARVVAAVCTQGQSLGRQLTLLEPEVAPRDRSLLRELCYGTLRQQPRLNGLVEQLLQKPFQEKDSDLHQLLLVGAYQLLYTRIPDHAALASTVEASRSLGKGWASGLINGVLRNLQRQRDKLEAKLAPAARDAHPEWLWQRLQALWPAQAEAIIAANNSHPPMCLRVNETRVSRNAYKGELMASGFAAEPCELAPSGLRLAQPQDVTALPGFIAGKVSVQDEAAQLAAILLDPQPRERVLDACCAPGGKTGHLLELQPALSELVAMDSDSGRLNRVTENLERLRLTATLLAADACDPEAWWDDVPFQRILLDAPCSGTGVIRRHPDIKVLRTITDIEALAALQGQMLRSLWPLLAPGGTLLYVTCSVLPEENVDVVSAFLADTPDASEAAIEAEWGIPQAVGRQLLPAPDGCDGFYYARLVKKG